MLSWKTILRNKNLGKLQALGMIDTFTVDLLDSLKMILGGDEKFKMYNKTSSLTPFTFNAIGLHAVSINGNPCIGAKEICRTPKYGKTIKCSDVLKCLCGLKDYAHKCQLIEFTFDGLAQGLKKGQLLHNEEEM